MIVNKSKEEYEKTAHLRHFEFIENYVYMHHTNTFVVIPIYPETISDSTAVKYNFSSPLSRSAPIYSYASSGPRQVQFDFSFHRDMMNQMNYSVSNLNLTMGDDYVDVLIKQLQGMALPRYASESKMVDPPMVSVRLGNELFIKGIVDGSVGVDYNLPLLNNDKYGLVKIKFTVSEVDPYDAETVQSIGSFRINTSLERNTHINRTSTNSPVYVSNKNLVSL